MADRKTKRLSPKILQDDLDAYAGMQGIAGYNPSNSAYGATEGGDLKKNMEDAQTKDVQDKATSDASRDAAVAKEWDFHDYIRNMRIQVKAQFGESSDEVAAVGLKKKSEYKSPSKPNPTLTP